MKNAPGIFNDVIGPVMRGPSSSHTAASWRIAKMGMDILNEPLKKAIVDFDKDGAWAPNYREQGTTVGIDGGLLGLEMTDDRMKQTEKLAREKNISILYEINSFPTIHVNTVRLTLEGIHGKTTRILGVSLGGGSMEIREVNGFKVKMPGSFYELLLFIKDQSDIMDQIKSILPAYQSLSRAINGETVLLNLKFSKIIPDEVQQQLWQIPSIDAVVLINPVMPIIAGNETELPFSTIESLLKYSEEEHLDLGDIGLIYEKCKSGLGEDIVLDKMKNIVGIIENSIRIGLAGTVYKDRILPQQSHLIREAQQKGRITMNPLVNDIIANVAAIMESKSAMEVVVANPTAGSCGAVGGVLRAVADDLGATHEEVIKAYFAAGMVGVYFAEGPGFSAEEHGCQVECGASAGMAAAGIAQLFGGSARQALGAASMAIQNMIGLVCDPVADRVEVPCLGKNISAAMNALSSATMAVAGFNAVIPLGEVIETVSRVSAQMPTCVKCTGKGGLAITKTAFDLKVILAKNNA
ncbi:MAG: L-serine ammonia-lyase, iron-sulfur-dependent, subunit alpha [Saprospiraceae bacterium]|nr:L-serine ammonia-lyase, iron-sulfur-dependent, subunit alpha [Saprospiraceae bacterium]